MKKLLLILISLCGVAVAQEHAVETSAPTLTIYNQNFFVARERLPLDLKAGVNHVDYAGVAAHLEPDSVMLRDPAGRALQILSRIIATILFLRSCCSRFMRARRLIFRWDALRKAKTSS